MSLKKFVFLLMFCPFFGQAQSLTKKEINSLFVILTDILSRNANTDRLEAKSEMFLLILETDSNNTVTKIHRYSDIENKDSSFFALSKLTAKDFNTWIPQNCKNKKIIIPIVSAAPDDKPLSPVNTVFADLFWKDLRKKKILVEKNNTIITNVLLYTVEVATSG